MPLDPDVPIIPLMRHLAASRRPGWDAKVHSILVQYCEARNASLSFSTPTDALIHQISEWITAEAKLHVITSILTSEPSNDRPRDSQ